MALSDKLDTIGDLASNDNFLEELINQLDERKVQSILGKIKTANKKVVQVSDLAEDTVVTSIVSSDKFKTTVLNDAGNPITTVSGLLTKLTTGGDKNKKVYTEKAVDDALEGKAGTGDVYSRTEADTKFATKEALNLKADATAIPEAPDLAEYLKADDLVTPTLAGKILGAKDGQKSILVEKLGGFLPGTDKVYDGKIAKAFLESKGLGSASADPSAVATQLLSATNKDKLGTAILGVTKKVNDVDKPALETDLVANEALRTAVKSALASDTTFQGNVKIEVNSNEPVFQGAVREVMLQPFCKIPTDENAPMCCYDLHPTCLLGA